jgi:hypothetical protein
MSLPAVMLTSEKATRKSMTRPSLSVPNALQTIIDPSGTTTAISASFAFSSFSRPQLLAWVKRSYGKSRHMSGENKADSVVSLKRSLTKGTWTC